MNELNDQVITQPEDNSISNERKFTQEEVNRIVSDRLTRERAEADKRYGALNTELENLKAENAEKAVKAAKETGLQKWLKDNDYSTAAVEFITKYGIPVDNLGDELNDDGSIKDPESLKARVEAAFPLFVPHIVVESYTPQIPLDNVGYNAMSSKLSDIFKPKKT